MPRGSRWRDISVRIHGPARVMASGFPRQDAMADATRISEISRFLLKYRNAGIFDAAAVDTAAANAMQCEGAVIPEGKPEEFVADLEKLGPTFIKIGQALSTRADFVPPEYLIALERMQDSVKPVPIEAVRAVVEAEFGVKFAKLFR